MRRASGRCGPDSYFSNLLNSSGLDRVPIPRAETRACRGPLRPVTPMTHDRPVRIAPADVHRTLARHILADGFDLVFDYEKSHGSWLHDCPQRPRVPRLPDLLRLEPDRLQPPADEGPGVPPGPAPRRPAQALPVRHLHASSTPSSSRRSRAWRCPPHFPHAFFIEGGALGDRERAQDRVRLEGAPQPGEGHRRARRARRSSTSARRSTAAAATRCRSRTPTRSRPTTSRSSPGRASTNPEAALPGRRPRSSATWPRPRSGRSSRSSARSPTTPTTSPRSSSSRSRPRAATTTSAPSSCRRSQRSGRRARGLLIFDEVQTGVGLTGTHVGARALGLTPDVVAFGKKTQVCGMPGRRRASTRSRRTSSRSARASTRPGAAGWPTWCAARAILEIIDEERLVENARVRRRAPAARACEDVQARARRPDVERARARPHDRLRPARRREARRASTAS